MALLATGSITFVEQFDEVYALLSSDMGQVSVDNAGTLKTPLSTLPLSTTISVYKANVLQTGWSFSKMDGNATSSINSSTGVLTVTGISADSAYVDITATKSGEPTITKRYVLTKVYQGESGDTGPQGPMGNPKALGVNKDLSKITVAGFNDDGTFGATQGLVYIGSSRLTLNAKEYTVSQNGYGYILGSDSGLVLFASLRAESDGTAGSHRMAWKEFNTNVEIVADAVIGQFKVVGLNVVMAEMIPGRLTDQFINTNFMEILRNASDNDAELVVMAMAMGADRVMQTLVAIEAFIKNLWVSRLESESFSEDGNGFPDEGFRLDGVNGIAKIANLIAKNADIYGTFASDGFKTLPKVTGATVPTATVAKTIYRYSEMSDLLSSGDEQQVVSGTIEGFSFTKANRRVNQRVLLQQTGSYTVTVSAGQEHIMSRITPSKLFGYNFFCEWHVTYTGNVGSRLYVRTKPNQTATQIMAEWWEDTDPDPDYENYVNQPDMTLKKYYDSGSYSGSYALTGERPDASVVVYSNAIWGSQPATSNYHKLWTEQAFNGLVLTYNDAALKIVDYQPDAFYLSSLKAFTVGAINQDSATMKKYASGTDFYNLFGALAVGTNSAATGVVNVNGTAYTITRLRKDADKIVFFTGSVEIPIYKFINGTNVGAYSNLQITTQIVVGAMAGGIESMWMIPWDGSSGVYDIGSTLKKFRSLFLSSELHSASVYTGSLNATSASVGTINAQGTTNKVWGAVFN